MDIRDKAFRRWKRRPKREDLKKKYTNLRNEVTRLLKLKKKNWLDEKFNNCRNDCKKMWKVLNEILGRGRSKSIEEILSKNFKDTAEAKLAEMFAAYFQDSVDIIKHDCNIELAPKVIMTELNVRFFIPYASVDRIKGIVDKIKITCSPGIDGIRAQDIFHVKNSMILWLTCMVNSSLRTGIFPEIYKGAILRPIPKKGSLKVKENYRPVSLLAFNEKLLEEHVCFYLKRYLQENNLIHSRQYAYQKGRGTEDLLIDFGELIHQGLEKGEYCLVLFIDFSKAFDTLHIDTLIRMLSDIGVEGRFLSWFCSYMTRRFYKVKIGEKLSNKKDLNSGTPQGSKLGPVLYLIYTRMLHNMIRHGVYFEFADDGAIIIRHHNLEEARKIMQDDFNHILKWAHDYNLVINSKKCVIMTIRDPHKVFYNGAIYSHSCECFSGKIPCSITTCPVLEEVSQFKYLGIIVTHNFKWDKHISHVMSKVRSAVGTMFMLKTTLPQKELLTVYYSLIESNIRYGIGIWGGAANYLIDKVDKLQRNALKLVKEAGNNKVILAKLKTILNVRQLRVNVLMRCLFLIKEDYLVKKDNKRYNLRERDVYELPRFRTESGKNVLVISY